MAHITDTDSNEKATCEKDDSLKIYLEDGKIKVKGTINLGYIGLFKDFSD